MAKYTRLHKSSATHVSLIALLRFLLLLSDREQVRKW
jgi:hypothetical protein